MKILLDTNVLISAFVFGGTAGRLMNLLFESEHEMLVSEYVDKEFEEKLIAKWPNKADKVYQIYRQMDFCFCESADKLSGKLRDAKDIPILSDALYHKADLILTGDKDFLEAGLAKPMVFSPAMMLEFLESK